MFTTPRKPRKGGAGIPKRSDNLKGRFHNGQWFCECEPRVPAARRQVKKEGKNKGRWFYTCQMPQGQQCDFFMFEDAAHLAEERALLSSGNGRSEIRTYIQPKGAPEPPLPPSLNPASASPVPPGPMPRTPPRESPNMPRFEYGRGASLPSISTGDEMDFMSLADAESQKRRSEGLHTENEEEPRGAAPQAAPSAKRTYSMFAEQGDDDEFDGSNLDSEEEDQMVALADSASQSRSLPRPGIDQRQQNGQTTTPSARRTHDVLNGLPTPGPSVGRNTLLIAAEQRGQEGKRNVLGSPATPSLVRTGSSNDRQRSGSSPSPSDVEDYSLTKDVMALLAKAPMLDDEIRDSVRQTLNMHELRMGSIRTGRDAALSSVEAKNAKIAELQARVSQLEKERSADRERVKKTLARLVEEMS